MKNKKLLILLPIRSLLFIAIFVIASAITGKRLSDISSIWSVAASSLNIITIVFLVLITRKHGGYLLLINYRKGRTKARSIVGMIFLILFAGMGCMCLSGFICYGVFPYAAPMLIAPIPVILAVLNLIVLPVSTALAEDALYLGCGVMQIENKYASIIIPALFFALQHSFIPTLFDARYIIYRFLSFLPLTFILCIHFRRHKNPLPIMIGHAVIDVATAVQILLTSAIPGFYEMMCSL